ncbi:serine/threonine-protein kinase CDG1-like isoform X1 [Ipomoea triloba]|uniref:serine/threonine-protein kinase CDG1-like isoform X1 n=2 Tax=Ipomoea triloba TaxID=35885 RepID=UPI00125CEF11|nr:serine/threonine-protein kinase CDG1-like isoform X1 [Ipomoea triloba]XP_031091646.1 serine/threonine-protein kinase CDG1-like isoform X1 [Ipomoea triloba]
MDKDKRGNSVNRVTPLVLQPVARVRNSLIPGTVVIAYDATKDRSENEFYQTIRDIRMRGDILHPGDTIVVLGVLHKVLHPMGYHLQVVNTESMFGAPLRAMEEEVAKKADLYVNMLMQSAEECESLGVDIQVKIVAGAPKKVIVHEVKILDVTWVVLDRNFGRDLHFYLNHVPCKVALQADNLFVEVRRNVRITNIENTEYKDIHSVSKSKPVPLTPISNVESSKQSVTSHNSDSATISSTENSDLPNKNLQSSLPHNSQENSFSLQDDLGSSVKQVRSGRYAKEENKYPSHSLVVSKQRKEPSQHRSFNAPILCTACGMTTELYINDSMRFSFSEIQLATGDFSKDNLLGEGGYGHVYKGQLKDGQLIAAKVRKEASTQGFSEFHSEVYVLSFARHKNIVMLLGYCCKENVNILVYEYICNKSLEWHLFDNTENILEWHQRYSIAIGTAKGLRFLHEECRGSPIIHRDMRPGNILLTHDFVPMLGDFGLAKWKTNEENVQTRILGSLGYLAPEYAENGIVSVRTDVYSFGIVLIQLISGRKVVDSTRDDSQQSLKQWAIPLIERLALHELIDPRIEDSYDPFEVYHMARTAFLCVQTNPEMRPSMAEVIRLLRGELEDTHHIAEQFIPHFAPHGRKS